MGALTGYPVGWLHAEYLMWWSDGMRTPTLLARASEATPQAGTPLVGGPAGDLLEGMRSGVRVRTGQWLDKCQDYGLEFEYLYLGNVSDSYSVRDDGTPGSTVYTRPFFNALTNQQDAELISFPGCRLGYRNRQRIWSFPFRWRSVNSQPVSPVLYGLRTLRADRESITV